MRQEIIGVLRGRGKYHGILEQAFCVLVHHRLGNMHCIHESPVAIAKLGVTFSVTDIFLASHMPRGLQS